nr:autophagy-related protein 13 homolog isoform X1 [Leptinotarsa decemlineata]
MKSEANIEKQQKYAKYFALKATQIIVQSRLGIKHNKESRPDVTGTFWFYLNIEDSSEVLLETKRVLNGEKFSHFRMCVEISLKTTEGDQMVLEAWCLSLSPENTEAVPSNIVYNRMGTLLKSLLSVTRVVPAYKLSRMQGPDSYVMCYRIYMGQPQEQCLGEDYKRIRIGQITSDVGTFHLSVSYRTKLTFSPTHTERNINNQPKTNLENQGGKEDDCHKVDLEKPMMPGAFVNPSQVKTLEDSVHLLVPLIPLGGLSVEKSDEKSDSAEIEKQELDENENCEESKPDLLKMESSTESNDDYIMVPLYCPFASSKDSVELADFIQQWKTAPSLEDFGDLPPPDESEVAKQLETFESDLTKFDKCFEKLYKSSDDED